MIHMLRICCKLCCIVTVLVVPGYRSSGADDSLKAGDQNGYAQLVEAAKLANTIALKRDMTVAEKRSCVAAGAKAIQLARKGLEMRCTVDVAYKPKSDLESLRHFGLLVELFRLTAEIAQQDHDVAKALNAHLDCIRLASAICSGGNMLDQSKSIAYMITGAEYVHAMRESLTKEQCRQTIDVLADVLTAIEPAETVAKREIGQAVSLQDPQVAPFVQRLEKATKMCQANLELCKTALAIRLYYLKQGHLPATLGVLLGEELHELPLDPWTGKPLTYRIEGQSYVLFATGPNGEVRL